MEIIRTSLAQPPNPNVTHEALGFFTDVVGTKINAGASNNAKGPWVSLGIPSANMCEFDLIVSNSGGSGNRCHVDIGVGPNSGAVTVIAPDIYVVTSVIGSTHVVDTVTLPLKLAAGVEVWARMSSQASGTSITQFVSLLATVAHPSIPPGFDNCGVIHGNQANSRVGSISIPMTNTWTSLQDPTARAYGAVLCSVGQSSTTNTTMEMNFDWGAGPTGGGSEVVFFRCRATGTAGNPIFKTGGTRRLARKSFAAGIRFSVRAVSTAAGETACAGLHGFW